MASNQTGQVINDVTTALQILNAAEPDIAAVIALLKNSTATLEQMLTDADTTESADAAKIKTELGQ